MMERVSEQVDWYYVLREFWSIYRFNSAGGSKPIRSHQREVRRRISEELERDPALLERPPQQLPACRWLGRALDQGLSSGSAAGLLRAVRRVVGQLEWEYGYQRIPRGLRPKYAYAELMGPRGPVCSEQLILGLVLFAPRCTYPAHSHQGISESYICLSGVVSENDAGVFAPGSLIFNPPYRDHRLTTGDFEPTLLAYAWTGTRDSLLNQPMSFSRAQARMSLADS